MVREKEKLNKWKFNINGKMRYCENNIGLNYVNVWIYIQNWFHT